VGGEGGGGGGGEVGDSKRVGVRSLVVGTKRKESQ
jgi:hypothetical protein